MISLESVRGRGWNECKRTIACGLRLVKRVTGEHTTNTLTSLREELSATPTVLFLCYGNICRSPFAAEYFEAQTRPDVSALSSGFYPESGRRSPSEAVEAASSRGVDLSSHRSDTLNQELLREADLVFLMDYENLIDLWLRHPQYAQDAYLLNRVVNSADPEIKDPHGGSREKFDETYAEIATAIDRIITDLGLNG